MAKITYKSSIPNDKPLWLLKLQLAVSQLDATGLKGNEQDFRNLKSFIDAEIRSLMEKRRHPSQFCGNRTPAG